MASSLAPLIAIVGSDGSGKSTICGDVLSSLRADGRRVELCYLGTGTGDLGNRIKSWPVVGPFIEGVLTKRAGQAREPGAKIPGLATALVIYRFSLLRRRRFARAMALRRVGVTVLTDRYPQIDIAGFYDGPGLSAARAESWLVQRLAARERAHYDAMVSNLPTLVVRLNVDVETALRRKPDHSRALLERKVAATPKLTFNGAHIVDLDASQPYPKVLDQTLAAVAAALA